MGPPASVDILPSAANDDDHHEPPMPESLQRYEDFLDTVLQRDLEKVERAMDEVYMAYIETKKLRDTVKTLHHNGQKRLETLVPIGCDTFMEAEVPDCSKLYVETAFGFYLQLTLEEAEAFLCRKERHLEHRLEHWRTKATKIKAQIHLFAEALSTLVDTQESS